MVQSGETVRTKELYSAVVRTSFCVLFGPCPEAPAGSSAMIVYAEDAQNPSVGGV